MNLVFFSLLFCIAAGPQSAVPPAASGEASKSPPADPLGRTTPRGTVLGFLKAAHNRNFEVASEYLNTSLRGKAAADLADQLFVVIDRRLPPHLHELSNRPEGSLAYPAKTDQDLVGTIRSNSGDVDILVERIDRGKGGRLWLFSSRTLASIPALYAEVNLEPRGGPPTNFLTRTRIAGISLIQWIAAFVGLPFAYVAITLLSRLVGSVVGRRRRTERRDPNLPNPVVLPAPLRVLLLVGMIRWALANAAPSLLARQLWSTISSVLAIAASVWIFIVITGWAETHIRKRLLRSNRGGKVSILRLTRWGADLAVVLVAVLASLHHFGVNPNATLAGLGVGGIAVALAAQKTLENVIGGTSIIFDGAVRVGDLMRVGETLGTIEDIGLRSTRIRTFERTVVTMPNGQIANVSLENLSLRDRFWFHHVVGLRYETTAAQMRSVLEGIAEFLRQHPLAQPDATPVRFLRLGAYSLDVEIFAHLSARDWSHFLDLQGQLLFRVMEIIENAGARLAIPAQTAYLAVSSEFDLGFAQGPLHQSGSQSTKQSRDAA